jgi:alpha-L-fucosidase
MQTLSGSVIVLGFCICTALAHAEEARHYAPTWESLDSREIPGWFDEAKFGIFIHWGVYSVPAYGPTDEKVLIHEYAEWYRHWMTKPDHPTYSFHRQRYGADFTYPEFAPMFEAELWEPEAWADLFTRSGARYVVLTAKHADGFCLWPSEESWNWNSVDVGPHRDLVGDLAAALRKHELKVGLYYCLFEWGNPWYPDHMKKFVERRVMPQLHDLVNRYKPDLVWGDGEWVDHSDVWRTREFLAWLFNESPVREHVVINDRWGKETRSQHGGYFTSEYGGFHSIDDLASQKWEECRGLGTSFGYNRMERVNDYMSEREVIHLLVRTVSKGGNLLLNIGPRADGRIPPIMEERLLQLGAWLKVNGEAIYGTRPWVTALNSGKAAEGTNVAYEAESEEIRFTRKKNNLYAIALGWPGDQLVLKGIPLTGESAVTLFGWDRSLPVQMKGKQLTVDLSQIRPEDLAGEHAFAFKIANVQNKIK